MPNVGSIIAQHNKKILEEAEDAQSRCNCEIGECPVEGECERKELIYQATLKYDGNKVDTYIGLTARTFLDRHKEHTRSFEKESQKTSTKLSKKVWSLKQQNKNYELKWEILRSAKSYSAGNNECRLCILEVYFILFQPEKATLNSRQEMYSKCRHKNKFKLAKF